MLGHSDSGHAAAPQAAPASAPEAPEPPLVVDLDGTLARTDTLHESLLRALRRKPWWLLLLPWWWWRGKAFVKQRLAAFAPPPDALPYHEDLLAWLRGEAPRRELVLCTAADRAVAEPIAAHLGLFARVMASDGVTNLGGRAKAAALVERYGERGFDYAGNASADVPVWRHARAAIVVAAPARVAAAAQHEARVAHTFDAPRAGVRTWLAALRLHQWLKNLLLAVPLLAAHRLADGAAWATIAVAFVSFGACASAVYVVNDLFDLEADRRHPRKRRRPFAAGTLQARQGAWAAGLLFAAAFALAAWVGTAFTLALGAYVCATTAYTVLLKRLLLIDCMTLAGLYTLRIVAGAVAVGASLTFWLVTFSMFLFLSLAFLKRYSELLSRAGQAERTAPGRAYRTDDIQLLETFGVASGHAAVVVLALYFNSEGVRRLYTRSEAVWLVVPLLVFWLGWMWMQAHRRRMHDDPLVFALKDPVSLVVAGLFFAALTVGALVGRG